MPDEDSVHRELTQVFRDVFGDDEMVVGRDLCAKQVEDWDSLTNVRLLLSVERKFNVHISAFEAANLQNAGELMDLIRAKTAT